MIIETYYIQSNIAWTSKKHTGDVENFPIKGQLLKKNIFDVLCFIVSSIFIKFCCYSCVLCSTFIKISIHSSNMTLVNFISLYFYRKSVTIKFTIHTYTHAYTHIHTKTHAHTWTYTNIHIWFEKKSYCVRKWREYEKLNWHVSL